MSAIARQIEDERLEAAFGERLRVRDFIRHVRKGWMQCPAGDERTGALATLSMIEENLDLRDAALKSLRKFREAKP